MSHRWKALTSLVVLVLGGWTHGGPHARAEPPAELPAEPLRELLAEGPVRAGVVTRLEAGAVLFVRSGKVVGRGELLPAFAGTCELRGRAESAGAFRLRSARRVRLTEGAAPDVVVPPLRIAGRDVAYVDGRRVPRFRCESRIAGIRVRAEAFVWDEMSIELRLWIEAALGFSPEQPYRVHVATARRGWRLLGPRGCRVESTPAGFDLVLPAARMRSGDALSLTLATGCIVADPTQVLQTDRQLLDRVGHAPRALPVDPALQQRFARLFETVARDRPRSGLASGDFLRAVTPRTETWTHGEFDATLAWLARSARARIVGEAERATVRTAAACTRDTVLHMLERNRRRAPPRLPVRHGSGHGVGASDPGHVFLEGAILFSIATARSLVLDATLDILDALGSSLVSGRPITALRELVWPLRAAEIAATFVRRRSFVDTAEWCLRRIEDGLTSDGWPDWPSNRRVGGGQRVELWFVAGLLLPTLRLSIARGSARAARIHRRTVARLSRLRWSRIGAVPSLIVDLDGRVRGAGNEPCARAWLVDGFAREPALRRFAVRWSKAVSRALPGETWDAPTQLALCARLAWLQVAISARAISSDPP